MATPLRALAATNCHQILHCLKGSSRVQSLYSHTVCVSYIASARISPPAISQPCGAARAVFTRPCPAITAHGHMGGHQQRRATSLFTSLTADELWDGVTGVSNQGRKRGRGKRVGRKKNFDLNKGQKIGSGAANMMWAGLNAPILQGREMMESKQLPPNPNFKDELVKIRDKMGTIKYPALAPLERGWSGHRFPGQSVGAPDKVADYEFEGFDSRVMEFKMVNKMTGTLGKKMRFTAFVVVGNKNGLAGYGKGKGMNGQAAIKLAKNRAAQRLFYIDRYEDHTVYHNMYNKFHKTKIFIHKKQKGHGLECHRALKTICQLIGIQDLHCKVEGSMNIKNITQGFFQALANQETHAELAERMKYHVVETRPERANLPVVVASPAGDARSDMLRDEEEDLEVSFERLYFGGKAEYKRAPRIPVYAKLKGYATYRRIKHKQRNQRTQFLMRRAGLSPMDIHERQQA